jgi:hypothetical protein
MNDPNIRFKRGLTFSRNLALVSGLYLIEPPEMTMTRDRRRPKQEKEISL